MTRTTTVERFRHFNDGISQSGMIRDGTIHRRCRRLKKPPDWRHSYVLDSSVDIYLSERFVGIRNEAYIAFDEPKWSSKWSGSLGPSLSQRHPLLWVNIMRKRNDLLEYRKNKDGRKWWGGAKLLETYWKKARPHSGRYTMRAAYHDGTYDAIRRRATRAVECVAILRPSTLVAHTPTRTLALHKRSAPACI